MELISREDVLYGLSHYLLQESPIDDEDTKHIISSEAISECMRAIKEAPAIESRIEGKWIESNPKNSEICRLVKCSNCDDTYIVNINIPLKLWATKNRRYCGACGAKMSNAYDSE